MGFNQVIHYNPREDMVDGSAALVYKAGKKQGVFIAICFSAGYGMEAQHEIIMHKNKS